MKIIADKEAKIVITQMCDVALKSGGLKNLNGITDVLNSMEDYVDINEGHKEIPKPEIKEIPTGETDE